MFRHLDEWRSKEVTGHLTSTGKPFFVFDDLFDVAEVDAALSEFRTILRPMMRRDETGGTEKKFANACFLHEVYQSYEASPCFNITRKYCDVDLLDEVSNFHWLFGALQKHPFHESMQYIYYEQSDNYGSHLDRSLFTFLWWLAPEQITGGDLILDGNEKVDFRHNRVILFPLQMLHEVTPVSCDGEGRYCVTNFLNLATHN